MAGQPEKLDLRSHEIADDKKQELLQIFPEIRTEDSKIDFDRLKLILGESVDVGKERYGMNWPGKTDCFKAIQIPSLGTLRPCSEESVNFDTSENLIIEGDNLEVLKLLQKPYLSKIKMIYIDPPYNSGNDLIYPDNYSESLQTYLEYTGQVDGQGKKFSTNSDTDGRFHTKWLNMMYTRLYLARNLLKGDGVIFISIDEKEVDNLKKICNEVFGEENFEGIISWRRRHNQPNDKTKMIGLVSEYIMSYSKNSEILKQSGVGKVNLTGKFSNPDDDPRGPWASKPWKSGSGQTGSRYVLTTPGGVVYDEEWLGDEQTYNSLLADKRIIFPKKGKGSPRKKYFFKERKEEGQCATNWWHHDEFGHNQGATDELNELFGIKQIFDNPKPTKLLKALIGLGNVSDEDYILDFFAGSGTIAQAAIELNIESGGKHKFIMIQLPEPCDVDTPAHKSGYKSITEICLERVRRVIKKFESSNEEQKHDLGFRHYKLDKSNFKPWKAEVVHDPKALQEQLFQHILHIREDRKSEDILYEILLKSGFPLTTPIETISLADKIVHSVASGMLFICLQKELTLEVIRAMAEQKPERIVCLDHGFAGNDQLKANAAQIFKTKGITSFKTI